MKSCTVGNVRTVDGNLATCDAEGCCVTRLSVHTYEMTGDGALGVDDGCRREALTRRRSTSDRWSIDCQLIFSCTP
jgi:hypothetical protein